MRNHRIRVEMNASAEDVRLYRRARPEVMSLPPVRQAETPKPRRVFSPDGSVTLVPVDSIERAKSRGEVSTGRKPRSADEMAIARAMEHQMHADGTHHARLAEGCNLNEAELLADKSVRSVKAKDREPKSIYSPAPTPRLQFIGPRKRVAPSTIGNSIADPTSARERPIPQPHGRVEKVMRANRTLNVTA